MLWILIAVVAAGYAVSAVLVLGLCAAAGLAERKLERFRRERRR